MKGASARLCQSFYLLGPQLILGSPESHVRRSGPGVSSLGSEKIPRKFEVKPTRTENYSKRELEELVLFILFFVRYIRI